MENNYYIPEIEEFHVGFEFEFKDDFDKTWDKTIIKTQSQLCNWTAFDDINKRVKYLDKEDIESLGFKYKETNRIRYWYTSDCFFDMPNSPSHRCSKLTLIHDPEYSTISIEGVISSVEEKIFEGTIKNKSELKKLMKQLNII